MQKGTLRTVDSVLLFESGGALETYLHNYGMFTRCKECALHKWTTSTLMFGIVGALKSSTYLP
eukprot:scaffold98773_cov18-Tisochrysis_lutea.AAC.1